jgi:hypothetical protein
VRNIASGGASSEEPGGITNLLAETAETRMAV